MEVDLVPASGGGYGRVDDESKVANANLNEGNAV
jgi:hypothetical protein